MIGENIIKTIIEWYYNSLSSAINIPAIKEKGREISYHELELQSNILAVMLQQQGIGTETPVGIYLERSIDYVVALLAVLKSGGCFVPLDKHYPQSRLNYIIKDTQMPLMITNAENKGKLTGTRELIWESKAVDSVQASEIKLEISLKPEQLAYIIYTSGSTGKPKGVEIEHKNIVNLLSSWADNYSLQAGDSVTQSAALGFDASLWEIFPALAEKYTLHFIPEEILLDIPQLINWLNERQVKCCFLSTPVAEMFLEGEWQELSFLQYLTVGGDRLRKRPPSGFPAKLINVYGPAECCIMVSQDEVQPQDNDTTIPSIGKPIKNTRFYLLDEEGQAVETGETGEIYIAGDSVGRGYKNLAEETAKHFLEGSKLGLKEKIIYRTGDLGRIDAEGNYYCLGRTDFQVKIRGQRIELEEIESVLTGISEIRENTVRITKNNQGVDHLVAWLILRSPVSIEDIRQHISSKLPDYMVPDEFVIIDQFPLTANGKIDYNALPAPQWERSSSMYSGAETELQIQISAIWCRLLEIENCGIDDNFYHLGGHSLLAAQVITSLNKELKTSLPVNILAEYPTIRSLSRMIESSKQDKQIPDLQTIPTADKYPLSYGQKELWVMHQLDHTQLTHNIMIRLDLWGDLDTSIFSNALKNLIAKHQLLHSRFIEKDGKPVYQPLPDMKHELQILQDVQPHRVKEIVSSLANTVHNLTAAPLFKDVLLVNDKNHYIYLICIHHLITDGWSMGVFVQALSDEYMALSTGKEIKINKYDYHNYVDWEKRFLNTELLQQEFLWWQQKLQVNNQPVQLNTSSQRSNIKAYSGKRHWFWIDEKITSRLKALVQKQHVTLFSALLAAFKLLICKETGRYCFAVGTPYANRPHFDLETMFGYFTNMVSLCSEIKGTASFEELVKAEHHASQQAFEHSHYPFGKLAVDLGYNYQDNQHPIFQVLFIFQNTPFPRELFAIDKFDFTELGNNTTNIDLTCNITEKSGQLECWFMYLTELYSAKYIDHLVQLYQSLLADLLRVPDKPLNKVLQLPQGITDSCWLLGDTHMLIICAEELLKCGYYIQGIVSADTQVQLWAKEKHLPCHDDQVDLYALLLQQPFDYLFSIINSLIIPQQVIDLPQKAAINYHDSPLPKYAGIYSTTWALCNNETSHGVSWHIITSKLDAGDILYQKTVPVGEQETAGSLNARCFAEGVAGFKKLLGQLRSAQCQATKQDLTKRSYFGMYKRPDIAFHLDYNDNAKNLQRMIRALDLGDTDNEIATAKILYNNQFYLIKKATAKNANSTTDKGTFKISDDALHIQTGLGTLSITELENIDGYPVSISQFNKNTHLQTLQNDELIKLRTLYKKSQQYEQFWIKKISAWKTLETAAAKSLEKENIVPVAAIKADSLAEILIFIALYFDQYQFSILIHELLPGYIPEFFSAEKPVNIDISSINSYHELRQTLKRDITSLCAKPPYARDIFSRYGKLHGMQLNEKAVVFHQGTYSASGKESIIIKKQKDTYELSFNNNWFNMNQKATFLSMWHVFQSTVQSQPETILANIELMTTEVRDKQLALGSGLQKDYPLADTWYHIFKQRMMNWIDNTAVIMGDKSLTYQQLDQKSTLLAGYLQQSGITPRTVVGVCLKRSVELSCALVAILKCGAVYLPLDPEYPQSRLDYMLSDSGCELLLLAAETKDIFLNSNIDKLIIDQQIYDKNENLYQQNNFASNSPAYLIYTSGSTGTPKGVLVSQRSMLNHNLAAIDIYGLHKNSRVLQFSSLSFDISIEEMFPTWLSGGCVVFRNEVINSSIREFSNFISQQQITVINLPTAFWHQLVSDINLITIPDTLETVIVGGEKVLLEKFNDWIKKVPAKLAFYNTYGPTEGTVIASYCQGKKAHNWQVFPIGKSLPNCMLRVLDSRQKLRPQGLPGELYLAGECVAMGYYKNQKETAKVFVKDPYGKGIAYRTGDLVCMNSEGDLEYLGRIDKQLKVNGFRIEPESIIRHLEAFPAVKRAHVSIFQQNEHKYLTAWLETNALDISVLKTFLKNRLPHYMIPERFVQLSVFPLSANGKIDMKALPEPAEQNISSTYKEPYNEFQRLLCRVFSEVLSVKKVSLTDNFFDLGGNSLLAMKTLGILEHAGMELSINNLFRHQDIEELSHYLSYHADQNVTPQQFSLININQSIQSEIPLIFCHMSPGDLLGYSSLLQKIDSKLPVFGLQSPALINPQYHKSSIAEMAKWYIKVLDTKFGNSRYILTGHCFGGTLAYEIASQLEARGNPPLGLILSETWLFPPQKGKEKWLYRLHKIQNIFRMKPADFIYYLRVKLLKHNQISPFVEIQEHGEDNKLFLQRAKVQNHHLSLISNYHYPAYKGHIHIFVAQNTPRGLIPDPTLGWNVVTDSYTIHNLNTTHSEIMRNPAVTQIADIIKKIYQQITSNL